MGSFVKQEGQAMVNMILADRWQPTAFIVRIPGKADGGTPTARRGEVDAA